MKKYIPQLFVFGVIAYLLFLIRPALLGQFGGTFQSHLIPSEYAKLEEFLSSQKNFSRTLWVPSLQRFGFYSIEHPAISGEDLFHVASVAGVLDILKKPSTEKFLQNAGVGYIIVPYDSEGELFLKDRRYDRAMYQSAIRSVAKLPWLSPVPGFGRIAVFATKSHQDHLFLLQSGLLSYRFINPARYTVSLRNVTKGELLVFTESYDHYWELQEGSLQIQSERYEGLFNSFLIPKSGSYAVSIMYLPQMWVNIGLIISGATAIVVLCYGVWFMFRSFAANGDK